MPEGPKVICIYKHPGKIYANENKTLFVHLFIFTAAKRFVTSKNPFVQSQYRYSQSLNFESSPHMQLEVLS